VAGRANVIYTNLSMMVKLHNTARATRLALAVTIGFLGSLVGCGSLGLETNDSGTVPPYGGDTELDETGLDPNLTDTDDGTAAAAPALSSFALTSHANMGQVTAQFIASDENQDLIGGYVSLTLNGSNATYTIPGDINDWGGTNETSTLQISGFSPGDSVSGTMKLWDAAGNGSTTRTDQVTLEGFSASVSETGDDAGSADSLGTISPPGEITGYLGMAGNSGGSYSGDLDWVKFRPAQGGNWSFSLTWAASGSDYDLHLLNSGLTTLANAVSNGSVQPEQLSYQVAAGSTYYLIVAGWSGNGGTYTVEIE
jgi:hypothetical protein